MNLLSSGSTQLFQREVSGNAAAGFGGQSKPAPCSAGGFSRNQPATTVFFSHAKSASHSANSIFLSHEISQPASQPASRTRPRCDGYCGNFFWTKQGLHGLVDLSRLHYPVEDVSTTPLRVGCTAASFLLPSNPTFVKMDKRIIRIAIGWQRLISLTSGHKQNTISLDTTSQPRRQVVRNHLPPRLLQFAIFF